MTGWTVKTESLLGISCSGYDVYDAAFGPDFAADLLAELKGNGWLDSDQLRPARTKADAATQGLLSGFAQIGGFGGDIGANVRGDRSTFVPRDVRSKDTFPVNHPLLHRMVSTIESTAEGSFGDSANGIRFDWNSTSVQIAVYPGNGESGYPRHCDRGEKCLRESAGPATPGNDPAQRILTFVYYLTDPDWDGELDGGALRMYTAEAAHVDVIPKCDRLVAFRSDLVEHEVMPSKRRERLAVTVWLYGGIVSNNARLRRGCLPPALPIPRMVAQTSNGMSIFVAIPAYRDKETWPTIKSLIESASFPDRVYVGVVFQVDTSSEQETRRFTTAEGSGVTFDASWDQSSQLRTILLDCKSATGPCYARYLAQSLHRGEDYVLMIDSHMRFRPNWDVYLIDQLNKTESPSKAVLTAYPPGYTVSGTCVFETRATVLVPWRFDKDGMLRQKGRLIRDGYVHPRGSNNDNIPCTLFAGGFNFFQSTLLDICPYERHHGLFFGEEISMAVRLWTHGFHLFAPPQSVCYHLWERNPLRNGQGSDGWLRKQRRSSLDTVRAQLGGVGTGLGDVRSPESFWERLGVNLTEQLMMPNSENIGLDESAFAASSSFDNSEEKKVDCPSLSEVFALVGKFMNE
ncbi:hypothetical protein THAOC_07805 [Thalassiosira oceanica]|uniref:procollagen-lysine 5-dioxygenase n=1 Tax=Thalassiosira oceanica TaxID=159749 RepID=K0TJM8_THAOC|nr:hypothetical protein THAOC_07805 [Thalassiosira oceanica]|eukprot:EJK70807.1 hypothetical protein THAOC_07805 [Thalassiosira oceanica]